MRQRKMLRTGFKAIAMAACLALSAPASAWGLKTHLWIGEKILEEVNQSGGQCRLDLGLKGSSRYTLNSELCAALRQHPAEFRAGVLGPDVFPDFVVGQVTTHPGSNVEPHPNDGKGKWTTGQYISHLLREARTPAELAFAYGYMVHAAGDVFAHTYVNNYAGDVFDLMEFEHRVELRHVVLEKYIEQRTPLSFKLDSASVRVPAALVVEKLIFDQAARTQYGQTMAAKHVQLMYDSLKYDLDRNDKPLVAKTDQLVASLEGELKELKSSKERKLRVLRAAEKNNAFKAKALPEVGRYLQGLGESQAILQVQQSASQIKDTVDAGIGSQSAPEPDAAFRNTLRSITNAADTEQADLQSIAKLDAMLDARKKASPAGRDADQLFEDLLNAEALIGAAEQLQRHGKFKGANESFSKSRKDNETAQKSFVGKLRNEIEQASAQEFSLNARLRDAREGFGWAKVRQRLRENRIAGKRLAMTAFVEASMAGALDVMNQTGDPVARYRAWSNCWTMVYANVPHQWLEAKCRVKESLDDIRADIAANLDAAIKTLPADVQELYENYNVVKGQITALAQESAWEAADKTVAALSNDQATLRLVQAMTRQEHTPQHLNEAYTEVRRDGKSLVLLQDAAQMVDQDLATRDGVAHPEEFQALRHSVTLAKLSLLDLDTINQMVRDHVGRETSLQFPDGMPLYPSGGGRTSLLPLMVKSIDGNHQWQAYGIPYPRNPLVEDTSDASTRRFGYNAYREPGYGMRLFADTRVRDTLFSQLFPTPFAGAIQNYLKQRKLDPFPVCSDTAFPVTTLPDGSAAKPDRQCPP